MTHQRLCCEATSTNESLQANVLLSLTDRFTWDTHVALLLASVTYVKVRHDSSVVLPVDQAACGLSVITHEQAHIYPAWHGQT